MIRVVTAAEAAARDRAAIDGGIPSRALMQRAGAASASEIALRFGRQLRDGVLVFAGPGNNGGDAWVVARALATGASSEVRQGRTAHPHVVTLIRMAHQDGKAPHAGA